MLRIIQESADLPVTIQEAREHCRAPLGGSDDVLVERALKAAVSFFQNRTNRIILLTTAEYRLDDWPCDWDLKIPYAPVREVLDIKYVDEQGAEQTLSEDDWSWEGYAGEALVSWSQLATIPALHPTQRGLVRVVFQAGYDVPGDSGSGTDPTFTFPEDLKIGILMLTSHWYENRAMTSAEQQNPVPHSVDTLINRFKIF